MKTRSGKILNGILLFRMALGLCVVFMVLVAATHPAPFLVGFIRGYTHLNIDRTSFTPDILGQIVGRVLFGAFFFNGIMWYALRNQRTILLRFMAAFALCVSLGSHAVLGSMLGMVILVLAFCVPRVRGGFPTERLV